MRQNQANYQVYHQTNVHIKVGKHIFPKSNAVISQSTYSTRLEVNDDLTNSDYHQTKKRVTKRNLPSYSARIRRVSSVPLCAEVTRITQGTPRSHSVVRTAFAVSASDGEPMTTTTRAWGGRDSVWRRHNKNAMQEGIQNYSSKRHIRPLRTIW